MARRNKKKHIDKTKNEVWLELIFTKVFFVNWDLSHLLPQTEPYHRLEVAPKLKTTYKYVFYKN